MMYRKLGKTPRKMDSKPYDYFKLLDLKQYKELTQEEIRSQYNTFFDRYTTPKKRVYGGNPNRFGFPSKYQGLTAKLISEINFVNAKRCEVICEIPTGFKKTIKFVVLKKQNGWLLDSVKAYSKSDDTWSNDIL